MHGNRRGKDLQLRVLALTIYYPPEKVSLVYNKRVKNSKPAVLHPLSTSHEQYVQHEARDLVHELRNFGEMRGIENASVYTSIFQENRHLYKAQKPCSSTTSSPDFEGVLAKELVNTFETQNTRRNPIKLVRKWKNIKTK